MKKLFTLLSLTLLTFGMAVGQSSVSATYAAGNISTNYISYSSTCNLADTLNIAVPAGALIVGMDVSYDMIAFNGAWMSEQRTRLECLNTANTESTFYAGSGFGGTFSYSRTGVNIANGISSGSVTLRMQAYRTWGSAGCGTTYNYIPNNSWSVTVYYCPATPPYSPIVTNDTVLGVCGDDSVMVSANSNYFSWDWENGDTNASTYFHTSGLYGVMATDSGGCPYSDSVFVSVINPNIFPVDTAICDGMGDSVTLDALYSSGGACVEVSAFLESNYQVADHNSYSGDDRGGIAITPDYLYYVGDNNTVRMEADDLSGMTSLPRRDGIFSDLSSGQVYTFWSTTYNDFYSGSPYNAIDAIREMDASLNYGTTISLDTTISAGSGSMIAVGSGYVIIWANNSDTFFHIDLATGEVTVLGTGNIYTTANPGVYYYNTENWAKWGISECNNGNYTVIGRAYYYNGSYVYSPGYMIRYDISTGDMETVTQFSSAPSDMACVTYSRWNQRWYFHYEGGGVFGGSSETAGYADIDAAGGSSGALNFNWSTGDSTQSINVLPSTTTTYTVEITDGVQTCSDTATVTVNSTPDLSLSITDVACKGDSVGAASSSINGGTSPFAYAWTPMDTNINLGASGSTSAIANVPAGTYYLNVVDDNGCYDMDTAYIWEPVSVFSPILNGEIDPLCSYSEDGRSIVLSAGGDAPYTFNWSNGVTNDTNLTLANGGYSVTVTDGNGCERVLSGDLVSPSAVEMSFTATGNDCEDENEGSASVTATGGTAPYAYDWDNGDDDPNANSLTSGYHLVTITDGNGCSFVDSVEITFVSAAPNIPLADSVEKCSQNTVMLDAGDEGASYLWSTGDTSQVITTNAGGLIFVTVTGPNGCEAEKSIFIVNTPCPTGISAIEDVPFFNVYPNPSNGVFNIEVASALNTAIDLQLTDLTGRVMDARSGALGAGSTITTLDLTALARGTYMLRMLRDGELITVRQIVIQ